MLEATKRATSWPGGDEVVVRRVRRDPPGRRGPRPHLELAYHVENPRRSSRRATRSTCASSRSTRSSACRCRSSASRTACRSSLAGRRGCRRPSTCRRMCSPIGRGRGRGRRGSRRQRRRSFGARRAGGRRARLERETVEEPPRLPQPTPSLRLRRTSRAGVVGRPLAVAITGESRPERLRRSRRQVAALPPLGGRARPSRVPRGRNLKPLRDDGVRGLRRRGRGRPCRRGRIVFADRASSTGSERPSSRVREATSTGETDRGACGRTGADRRGIPLSTRRGRRFDKVVVVTAPGPRRRRGVPDREARLIPEDEKMRRADFAYVNDGSLEELDAFVDRVVQELASSR